MAATAADASVRVNWEANPGDKDVHGSASFMASVGSALLCRRFDSFSSWVSCKLFLFPEPLRGCDLSEWKLKVLRFAEGDGGCGACDWY